MSVRPEIIVYRITDDIFEPIGEVDDFTSLIWPRNYNSYSEFQMSAPLIERNKELLKKDYYLYKKDDTLMKIQIVDQTISDDGEKTFKIKGRSLEELLTTRVVWADTYTKTDVASTVICDLVNNNCVNPTLTRRKIPYLSLDTDPLLGDTITSQLTGSLIYKAVNDIATEQDLGIRIVFDPTALTFKMQIYKGTDRTINQSVVDPVMFDTDLEDILKSEYYINLEDTNNVGWTEGQEISGVRFNVISGDDTLVGLARREDYIDASSVSTDNLDNAGYLNALKQYGAEYLQNTAETETFEATIRTDNNKQHVFNQDYFLGDKVTITDNDLGVTIDARITAVEEDYDDTYSLNLTFGYGYPTLVQKLNKRFTK